MIDIRTVDEVSEAVNAVLNNGGIAEVKVETWKDGEKIVVVEQSRSVKVVCPHN